MPRVLAIAIVLAAALSFACDDLVPDAGGSWSAKLNAYTTWDLTLTQDSLNLTGTLKTTVAKDQANGSPLADYLPTEDLALEGKIATSKVVLNKTYEVDVSGTKVPITLNFDLTLSDDKTKLDGTVNFGGIPADKVPEATQNVTFTKK